MLATDSGTGFDSLGLLRLAAVLALSLGLGDRPGKKSRGKSEETSPPVAPRAKGLSSRD